MDFLNKAFAQFNDLFRSMTPGGRITTGLLLVVAVVSVGYLFQSQVGGGDDYLFGDESISTATLEKMAEAFGKAGLNDFTMEGGRVKVPHSQRAAYLAALADTKALPPNFGDKFKRRRRGRQPRSSLPSSVTNTPIRAKDEELSDVIRCLKGIERASVLIDQRRIGEDSVSHPLKTASVSAAYCIGGVPLD